MPPSSIIREVEYIRTKSIDIINILDPIEELKYFGTFKMGKAN